METFYYLIGEDAPHISWWQMTNRVFLVFPYAIMLYRIAPRRSLADFSALDVVLTVVTGSMLSRALTGNAPLLPVLAATAVLVLLYATISVLAPRSDLVSFLVKGRPAQLISDGKVDWPVARRFNLGSRDLEEQIRLKGVSRVEDIDAAFLERNGAISVIKRR